MGEGREKTGVLAWFKEHTILIVLAVLTVAWLSTGGVYLTCWVGWDNIRLAEFNAVGDFLAGFFSPLAFAWFVGALVLQSKELSLQREELEETRKTLEAQRAEMAESAKQAKIQAEALSASMEIQKGQYFSAEIRYETAVITEFLYLNLDSFFPNENDSQPVSSKIQKEKCVDYYIKEFEFMTGELGHLSNVDINDMIKSVEILEKIKKYTTQYEYINSLYESYGKFKNKDTFSESEYGTLFSIFSGLLSKSDQGETVKNAN